MTKKKEDIDQSFELERLKVYATQLKVVALNAQLDSIQQRHNAIQIEISLLPTKAQEVQKQRDALLEQYKEDYTALKKAAGVPEGSDLNLETGEIVESPKK